MREKIFFFLILILLASPAGPSWPETGITSPVREKVTAVILEGFPPISFIDPTTGKPDGLAVDIMNRAAERAGLDIRYVTARSWTEVERKMKRGEVDVCPGMGVSDERREDLVFSIPIEVFSVSFFVRSQNREFDATSGSHVVGVMRGSVAFERLKSNHNLHLVSYDSFQQGLFDLLAGRIDAFACPSPTLLQLARQSGVEDRIRIAGKPIAEVKRAIALRKNNVRLLEKINLALDGFIGQADYQRIYVKWYGRPAPYWTAKRILIGGSMLLAFFIGTGLVLRYRLVRRHNRELIAAHAELERKVAERTLDLKKINEELEREIAERKLTEEEVRQSEKQFRALFDNTPLGIAVVGTDRRIVNCNTAFQKMLGYTLEELKHLSVPDISDPGDDLAIRDNYRAMTAGKTESFTMEKRYFRKDGTVIWTNLTGTLMRNDKNETQVFFGIVEDITERKRVKEALQESQTRFQALFEQSNDGIAVGDLEGRYVMVNPAFCRMTGYSREELLHLRVHDLVPDTVTMKLFPQVAGQKLSGHREVELRKKDGTSFIASISGTILKIGSKEYIYGIHQDITERKRAEEKLQKSERQLRESQQVARLGSWDLDLITPNLEWSDETYRLFDQSPEKFVPTFAEFARLIHPDDRETMQTNFDLALASDAHPYHVAVRITNDSGRQWVMEAFGAVRRDENGKALRIVGTAQDITERKQTEEEREHFFKFFNTSNDLMCIAGLDGYFKITNPAWMTTLGYTAEELLQKPFSEFIHPADVEATLQEVASQSAGSHYTIDFVNRYRSKDGSYKWFEWKATPPKDGLIYAVARDITERKQSAEALSASEKRYRTLFNQSPDGVLLIDGRGGIVDFNDQACRQLGYTREEFKKMRIVDHDVCETPDEFQTRFEKVTRDGKAEFEVQHKTKNGEIRDVHVIIQVINLMGEIFHHSIWRDITGQKQAENRLRASIKKAEEERAKTEAIIAAIGEGFTIRDTNYRIIYQNQINRDSVGDHVGEYCYKAFHNVDRVCDGCPVERSFRDGNIHRAEMTVTLDGRVLHYENVASPVRDANGTIIAGIELNRNITASRRLQEKLETLNRTLAERVKEETEKNRAKENLLQLQSRHAAMGEMINNIAHQWRQPLNNLGLAIQGLQAKFRQEALTSDIMNEKVTLSMSLINYMSQTINDFSNFFRQDKSVSQFRVRETVMSAIFFMETSLKQKAVRLEINIPEEIVVTGHKNEYTQVVVNILSNARDVLVERQVKNPMIRLHAFRNNGASVLTIADNGGGIPEGIKDKIFIPYFTTKEHGRGTGIGLYISKTIIENNMHGKLSVSNREDGAEFRIEV